MTSCSTLHRSIEETTALLNQALDSEEHLHVRTVESPTGSWRIAEGVVAGYPAVLTDTKGLDDAESRGFNWSLGLTCAVRPGGVLRDVRGKMHPGRRGHHATYRIALGFTLHAS